jgi:hypothetical protein
MSAFVGAMDDANQGEDGWCHVGVDELTILGVGDVEVYKRIA